MIFITLIPTRRNDGSAVSEAEQNAILTDLWNRFGGVTKEGLVEGHWIDTSDGKHYQDQSIKILVACESSRLREAEETVIEIGRQLDQRAMYFEVRYFDGVRFLDVPAN